MKWAAQTAPSRRGEPNSGHSRAGLTKARAKRLTGGHKAKRRQPSLTIAKGWSNGNNFVPFVEDTPAFRARCAQLDAYAATLRPGEFGSFEKAPPQWPNGQVQIYRGIVPGEQLRPQPQPDPQP